MWVILLLVNAAYTQGISGDHNNSMFWGTYRPNLYFGTRTRTPQSLLTGLMWFGVSDLKTEPWQSERV